VKEENTDLEQINEDRISALADTIENKFLIFKVGHENFGIEISIVHEIINIVPITQVPRTPNYLKGIINLRGDIVSIIDLRTRFMMEEVEYDDLTCIIVVEQEGEKIGIIVDEVFEVKYISKKNMSPPPSAKLVYSNKFVKTLGNTDDKVILLVDVKDLFYDE